MTDTLEVAARAIKTARMPVEGCRAGSLAVLAGPVQELRKAWMNGVSPRAGERPEAIRPAIRVRHRL
jgi:hypothetical protein